MTAATRWFRTWPDSSQFVAPRLLTRLLIPLAHLDDLIGAYETLLDAPADLRMPIPDFGGLELSAIGGLLLIASERPFTDIQRATRYSQVVPSLHAAIENSLAAGAEVLEPVEKIVPGARARLRYPDGSLAELVEHRTITGEQPHPAPPPGRHPAVRLLARRSVPAAIYPDTVEFYERILDAPAASIPNIGITATRIGGLLLVADDDAEESDQPRAALWTNPETPADELTCHPPRAGTTRPQVTLPGGLVAETWTATP